MNISEAAFILAKIVAPSNATSCSVSSLLLRNGNRTDLRNIISLYQKLYNKSVPFHKSISSQFFTLAWRLENFSLTEIILSKGQQYRNMLLH
jgi:hypothetical protein